MPYSYFALRGIVVFMPVRLIVQIFFSSGGGCSFIPPPKKKKNLASGCGGTQELPQRVRKAAPPQEKKRGRISPRCQLFVSRRRTSLLIVWAGPYDPTDRETPEHA